MDLLDKKISEKFSYPDEFLILIEQGTIKFWPWYLLEGVELEEKYKGLRERYPQKKLIPFATKCDSDDVACWVIGDLETVYIVHDYASKGFETVKKYKDFWNWFRHAIEDMIEYNM